MKYGDLGVTYWLEKAEAEMRELGRTVRGAGLASGPPYRPGMDRRRPAFRGVAARYDSGKRIHRDWAARMA
jgi:hypothetical protein